MQVRQSHGDSYCESISTIEDSPRMNTIALHEALASVHPLTPEGADALLDLRESLLSDGHPGTCIKCFFKLLGDLQKPGALQPLRHLLEERFELEVSADSNPLDILPLHLDDGYDLESFCMRAIETVRFDRAFPDRKLTLRLRRKNNAFF